MFHRKEKENEDELTFVPNLDYDTLRESYLAHKNSRTKSVLFFGITSRLCEMNMLEIDFWNTRQNLLKDFFDNHSRHSNDYKLALLKEYDKICLYEPQPYKFLIFEMSPTRRSDFISLEINWVLKCLIINPKNYQVWNHIMYISKLLKLDISQLTFIEGVIERDSRNIHIWTFLGIYCMQHKKHEYILNLTQKVILADPTNNSAWNCRYNFIKELFKKKDDIFMSEICFIKRVEAEKSALNYIFALSKIRSIDSVITELHKSMDFKYRFVFYTVENTKTQFFATAITYINDLSQIRYPNAKTINFLRRKLNEL